MINGEPLIFDWNMKLLNGQHRLYACIETGEPFPAAIMYGVNPDAFSTMDGGKTRTAAQILQMAQFENTSTLSTACRYFFKQQLGWFPWSSTNEGISSVSSHQLLLVARENPGIIGSTEHVRSLYGKGPEPRPSAGFGSFFHYVVSDVLKLRAEVETFLDLLFLGANPDVNCPIKRFRDYMAAASKTKGGRLHGWHQQKAWIIAWELWRAQISLKTVKAFEKEVEGTPKPFITGLPLSENSREQARKENKGKVCRI